VCARAGKPTSVRVLWAALAICFSCAISSTLSAADRSGLAPSLWEQLDEPARCAALEILAHLIARMLVAAANEASH
jgi:hypothetical protein